MRLSAGRIMESRSEKIAERMRKLWQERKAKGYKPKTGGKIEEKSALPPEEFKKYLDENDWMNYEFNLL